MRFDLSVKQPCCSTTFPRLTSDPARVHRQLVDLSGEAERDLVVLVIHRRAGIEADVEAIPKRDSPNQRIIHDEHQIKNDQEIFSLDVSDEALEIAARAAKEKSKFTLGSCTGLSECPAEPS